MQDERTESSVSPSGPRSEVVLLSEDHKHGSAAASTAAAGAAAGDGDAKSDDGAEHDPPTSTHAQTAQAAHALGDSGDRDSSITSSAPSSPLHAQAKSEHAASTSTPSVSGLKQESIPKVNSEAATEAPVAVGNPYRRRSSRHAKPKGILKPPPPPQAKFSFRRDVLGYVVGEAAPLQNLNPINAALNLSNGGPPTKIATSTNATPSSTAAGPAQAESSTTSSLSAVPPQNAHNRDTAQLKPAARGGLWRRLGGAVTAVAGSVPVPQNAVKTLNSITAAVRPSTAPETTQPGMTASDHAQGGLPRSNEAQQQSSLPDSLKADYVKSVRFTMSSLSVVYPINGPGPPGIEAETRKRVNKEHLARQENREKNGGWTNLDLLDLYEECCRTREEPGIAPLRTMLMVGLHSNDVIEVYRT